MEYTVRITKETKSRYEDKNRNKWPCLLPEEYKKLPRTEKRICGDVRKKDSGSLERILRLESEDESCVIGLYEYKARKKWNETVVGYIPAEYGGDGAHCCARILKVSPVKTALFTLLILTILAGIILSVMWYLKSQYGPGLDDTAVAYRMEGLVNTDPDRTMIPMVSEMYTSAGEGKVDTVLVNPEGNGCYFIYSIVVDDTGEVLYESGMVEPGKALVGFELDEAPEPGTYNVTVKVETRDIEDFERQLNGGDIKTTLTVSE